MAFDITKGYKREELPQVPLALYDKVLEILETKGATRDKNFVICLEATQLLYDIKKVVKKVVDLDKQQATKPHKVFIVADELHVLDGHHTMQAWKCYNPRQIVDVIYIDKTVEEALVILQEAIEEATNDH